MLKDIGTWLVRKGIWFLLVLIGFIVFWNLKPVWQNFEQEASEAEIALAAQTKVKKDLKLLQKKSLDAVSQAKNESNGFIEERILAEDKEIESITAEINAVNGFSIQGQIDKKYLNLKKSFAVWRRDEYKNVKISRLDAVYRSKAEKETLEKLRKKEKIYAKKYDEYQSIPVGVSTSEGSTVIKQANKWLFWSSYEIIDTNKLYDELNALKNEIQSLNLELANIREPNTSLNGLPPSIEATNAEVADLVKNAQTKLESSWFHAHIIQPVSKYWVVAFFTVILAIIFSPLARVICFYLLAPLAARQSPITLQAHAGTLHEVNDKGASNSGITVNLLPGQVLLAHHDYVKAIPKNCTTSTQLLVDSASPMSSLFSGLYNLLRVETPESITIAMSSGHDGLNELICIDLANDAEITIEPRNIVGVVASQGNPVRLKKHWALGKLQSWLKWQFRYITISGPITLILKGGRGLTISPVNGELVLAPDYVVGFSSHLGYGSSRCETFGGYYSRKKSLLNDRFIGTSGVVIHQEANFASSSHQAKSGIEGIMDGLLKAFGI